MKRDIAIHGTLDERIVTGEDQPINSRSVQRRRALQGAPPLYPPLMSHVERRRLIEAPITFRIVPPKTHAGTLIVRELPTEGRKRPHGHAWDESFYTSNVADIEDLIAAWED